MKRSLLTHTLVAFLAACTAAFADFLYGGIVSSASSRVSNGCFEVLSPTSIQFTLNGTADFTDGGPASDVKFRAATCTSTGANLSAAWNAAIGTCVPLWRTANRL